MLLFLLACPSSSVESTTYTDAGTACLEAPSVTEAATVTVDPSLCLSSSCDVLVSATCTAEVVDTTITVHSEFVVESPSGDATCSADCGMPTATCDLGVLPAGTYTLVYGSSSETITLPTTETCDGY